MSCDDVSREVDAYVDRELDADTTRAVRAHLDECPGCRRQAAEREALGRLVRALPYYSAPDRLRAHVSARIARTGSAGRVLALAAGFVLAVSLGAALMLLRLPPSAGDAAVEQVVDGHVRSLMADHLFDVESTDRHTVKPWFQGRLDFSPPVLDVAPLGYPLVGGRLDYLEGRPVAALVYRRRMHAINVFIAPAPGAASVETEVRTVRGFHVRHWRDQRMSFWAVSDVNDAELDEFARALGAP